MNSVWKFITLFFLGAIVVLVVTHSSGFSQSAGTIFTGINTLGTTLTGSKQGGGSGTGK